jgi:hypothetical protein
MQNFQIKSQKMLNGTLGDALKPTISSCETWSSAQKRG